MRIEGLEDLNELNWAYRAARVLHVANDLDVFKALSEGPMTAEQIAQHCHSKPETTEKILIACTALGLLQKTGERYANSNVADSYLVPGRRLYQGDIIRHSASVWNVWHRLIDEIRSDECESVNRDEHRNFIMGMDNIASRGRAQTVAQAVDLSGRHMLLDVGGGPGTYAMALCRAYPSLQAVIFDLPETVAIAREVIAREQMEKRVTVREGDWNVDAFGEGFDVVLLSNVLHGFVSKAVMKLDKACHAMVPGAVLIVQDFVLDDDKTGPLIPALFNVMVGAYSRSELFGLIERAGLTDVKVAAVDAEAGSTIITAEKPQ